MEQFEYGELVEVRDHDNDEWQKRHYLMTAPEGKFRYFTVYPDTRLDGFRIQEFEVYPFAQIRKIQKPEPGLIDIEQPEQGTIEYLQGQIHTLNKRLMALESKLENQDK